MKPSATPTLDSRTAADLMAELLERQAAWTPELEAAPGEPAWALFQIFSRYGQGLIDRLNQAPDRNLLAFLDTLGISLIPPQPSRAPVVFTPVPNAADAIIPERTRLSAKLPGTPAPLIFETDQQAAMAAAKLTDVITLWPARDRYAVHTAEAAGKRSFTLFEPLQDVPHVFYLAHETVFTFSGKTSVEIEFVLAPAGSQAIQAKWEFWDGQVWRPFQDIDSADPETGHDGTNGFTRSGILSLRAGCGQSKPTAVNGITAHWIRGRVDGLLPPVPGRVLPLVDRVRVRSVIENGDLSAFPPDTAFADAQKLDVSKAFFPFDQQPKTGATFYLDAPAAFSKAGAEVTLTADDAPTISEAKFTVTDSPDIAFEFWDGSAWQDIGIGNSTLVAFISTGTTFSFTIPKKISKTNINEVESWWLRMRITRRTFANVTTATIDSTNITLLTVLGPALQNLLVSYTYRSSWMFPDHCLTFSDFQWGVHDRDVRWPGDLFPVFQPVADTTPAIYFGFDRPLPNDFLNIYFDIQETSETAPPLVWEAWNGTEWAEITIQDDTGGFTRPGMISLIPPLIPARPVADLASASALIATAKDPLQAAQFKSGDQVLLQQEKKSDLRVIESVDEASVVFTAPLANNYTGGTLTLAALPRFGVSRDWIRARLKEDGAPLESQIDGVFINAAWAVQVETVTGEVLGGSSSVPNQSFFFNKIPVLPGEQIEVRELDGPRAEVEYPILREELLAQGYQDDEIRISTDPRTGKTTEVWVLWRAKPHFFFSGADDRHYVMERSGGRVIFGDGAHGKIPPAGSGNIRARIYRAGGGLVGNVPAGAIRQIMSGVLASGVSNPKAGEGGADGETVTGIRTRGPHVFRHQERSLSALDYEMLVREASPAVAAARVLPATTSNGRPAPGYVTIIIVPQSQDPQPQPSFGLRQDVHAFLAARAPATVRNSKIAVIGPVYLPVGVSAVLVPKDLSTAGTVEAAATAALQKFLHPLTGGPEGTGWAFGRSVFISDVAAILEDVSGLDHVEFLELRLNDTPVGDVVTVPVDRMVVAGSLRLEIRGV